MFTLVKLLMVTMIVGVKAQASGQITTFAQDCADIMKILGIKKDNYYCRN